jgi:hypothetical protein
VAVRKDRTAACLKPPRIVLSHDSKLKTVFRAPRLRVSAVQNRFRLPLRSLRPFLRCVTLTFAASTVVCFWTGPSRQAEVRLQTVGLVALRPPFSRISCISRLKMLSGWCPLRVALPPARTFRSPLSAFNFQVSAFRFLNGGRPQGPERGLSQAAAQANRTAVRLQMVGLVALRPPFSRISRLCGSN